MAEERGDHTFNIELLVEDVTDTMLENLKMSLRNHTFEVQTADGVIVAEVTDVDVFA